MTTKMILASEAEARTIKGLTKSAYANAVAKGFHDDDESVTIAHRLQLIMGEVNEAFEEIRAGHTVQDVYYTYSIEMFHVPLKGLRDGEVVTLTGETPESLNLVGKPEGFGVELADTLIRILDVAGTYGLDLEQLVLDKMKFNSTREHKHGKAF